MRSNLKLTLNNLNSLLHPSPASWVLTLHSTIATLAGDVLITISTAEMSDAHEERTGLVSGHAYIVQDLKEVNGVKLLKIKNPWNRGRWKGAYSPSDERNWTKEMEAKLNYNRSKAAAHDDGEFYMQLEAAKQMYVYCVALSLEAGLARCDGGARWQLQHTSRVVACQPQLVAFFLVSLHAARAPPSYLSGGCVPQLVADCQPSYGMTSFFTKGTTSFTSTGTQNSSNTLQQHTTCGLKRLVRCLV
jgi:hypothetical protein